MNGWSSIRTPALLLDALRAGILLLSFVAISAAIVACSIQGTSDVSIAFALSGKEISIVRDLRFYIYDVELIDAERVSHPVRLHPGPWQSERLTLIDMIGTNDSDRNTVVRGEVQKTGKRFTGLRFAVGVPFELNHGNPLTAAAPLNRAELFWAWQTGYKFIRADFDDADRERSFHLGSTGCSSASALRAPRSACAQPNLMRVELRDFDPLKQAVQIKLDELALSLRGAPHACTGNYAHDAACRSAFAITGLDAETGRCSGDLCANQRLFGAP